jgi:hypothetical protein
MWVRAMRGHHLDLPRCGRHLVPWGKRSLQAHLTGMGTSPGPQLA